MDNDLLLLLIAFLFGVAVGSRIQQWVCEYCK